MMVIMEDLEKMDKDNIITIKLYMVFIKETILLYIVILAALFYYKPELIRSESKYRFILPVVVIITAIISYYIISCKCLIHFGYVPDIFVFYKAYIA